MTISSTTVKNSYNGNGSTVIFTYTFRIFQDADLEVIIRSANGTETTKTLNTHYTVQGAGNSSGGTITFLVSLPSYDYTPLATEKVIIRRKLPQTQSVDYIANDPFPAESHEEALDRAMMSLQEMQEELNRAIKLSKTNTINSTEFTKDATDRANKVFGFDASGELTVATEIGTYKGNWSTATSYVVRDIVKDTSNANIYICLTAHTSTGSQPISSNADVAKWGLIVDAASASTSATNAANSATAAATSATNAASSASSASTSATNASNSASSASTSASNASTSASNAATSATNAASSATSASSSASTATTKASEASTSATNASNSASAASTSASNAAGSATVASDAATNASSYASAASSSATSASSSATSASTSATNAASSATSAASSATSASTSATNAANSYDAFDDRYLGSKSSDPSLDNDGNALLDGALYWNTVDNRIKVYDLGNATWKYTTPSVSEQSDINTVATNIANVNSVGSNITNVNSVATNSTNINTVATNITNVNNVGGSIANVNTVASNLSGVNSFAERYRVQSTDPSTSLDQGDLVFNTSSLVLKYYNGTSWETVAGASGTVSDITSNDNSITITTSGTTKDLSVNVAASATSLVAQVRNETGATLTKGTIVYISGAAGNKALVSKARADVEATSSGTFGFVNANISNNSNGYVTVRGALSGINTSAFTDGDTVYLSPSTAGAFTATKPTAPDQLVVVGVITYAHVTQGIIEITIQNGYELSELHDVGITSLANNNVLIYNSTSKLWENKAQSNLTAGAVTNGVYLNDTQTLTNKSISLGSNTVTGTTAQFNTALSDNDFATQAGVETLTNKTISLGSNTVSGTIAEFNTAVTDADFATLAGVETLTNKTLTTPIISSISNTGTLTLPTSTDTLVGRNTTDTLINKTLTAPVISSITNTGTLTLPTSTDTLVGKATTDTLTNKSISLGANTITGTTAEFNTALTDGDFATLAGSETLTNKTLTTPVISTISNTGTLTLPTSTDTLVGRATTDTLTNKTLSSPVITTAATLNAEAELRLADADSSNYVGFKSPATVSTNKVWTLPSTDGTSGQVLSTDGSGTLSFSTPTSTGPTAGFVIAMSIAL